MSNRWGILGALGIAIVGTVPKALKNPSFDWIFFFYNFLYIGVTFYIIYCINKLFWFYKNDCSNWVKFIVGFISCFLLLGCFHYLLFNYCPGVLLYLFNLKVFNFYIVTVITLFRSFIVQLIVFSSLLYIKSKDEKRHLLERISFFNEYPINKRNNEVEKNTYKDTIFVRFQSKIIPIDISEIAFFHASDGVVQSCLFSNQRYIQVESLENFEKMLHPDIFYRANRQFLIHKRAIKTVEQIENRKLKVTLSVPQPEDIVISKAKASALIRWLEC